MKTIKRSFLMVLASILAVSSVSFAQQKTTDEIKKMVESKNFVFKAETANPAQGGTRQLSQGYDLTITNSSIVSYLPFFGKGQIIPTDGGIKFTSTDFEYKSVPGSKGWQITIKIKDVNHVQQLYLTIFDNGNATLDVMNIHRDNISFRGYISDAR